MDRVSEQAQGLGPAVLRQSGAVLVPVAVYVFCALVLADSFVEDGTALGRARLALAMGSIAFLAWMFLASPSLVLERAGVRIVNPLRVRWIPFEVVDEVQVRGLTTVVARGPDGRPRRITSWNGPGVPRAWTAATPPVAAAVGRRRTAWEQRGTRDPGAVLTTTWRWRPLAVVLVLTLAQVTIWWR